VAGRRPSRAAPVGWSAGVVAAALATALAAPLILHAPTERAGPSGSAELSAVKVLTSAALAASRAPAPRFGPGKYWYVRERVVPHRVRGVIRGAGLLETRWGADGSLVRWSINGSAQLVPTRKMRIVVLGAGWVPDRYQELLELPTQPERLAAELTKRTRAQQPDGGWPASWGTTGAKADQRVQAAQLFVTIGWLLGHYPLPPKLQAALYQALTRLDGVELLGATTDLAGRRAVGVAIDLSGTTLGQRREFRAGLLVLGW
jgi:hypothetical protein